uniref:Uncharacterized protein n=1 Tax=Myoviridae sp. ctn8H20 TaxID=2825169 RepID=A0A8S5QG04_9CAUD|nr:MAG TPA: hypothetical protein [Myoviridae sp. ctn8H20]
MKILWVFKLGIVRTILKSKTKFKNKKEDYFHK